MLIWDTFTYLGKSNWCPRQLGLVEFWILKKKKYLFSTAPACIKQQKIFKIQNSILPNRWATELLFIWWGFFFKLIYYFYRKQMPAKSLNSQFLIILEVRMIGVVGEKNEEKISWYLLSHHTWSTAWPKAIWIKL